MEDQSSQTQTQTQTQNPQEPVYPGGTHQSLEELQKEILGDYDPAAEIQKSEAEALQTLGQETTPKAEAKPTPKAEPVAKAEPKPVQPPLPTAEAEAKRQEDLRLHLNELASDSNEAISTRINKSYVIDDRRTLMDEGKTREEAEEIIAKQQTDRQRLIEKATATARKLDSAMSRVKLAYGEFDRKSSTYNGDLNKLTKALADTYAKPTRDRLTGEAVEALDPFDIYKTSSSIYNLGYQAGQKSEAARMEAEQEAKIKDQSRVAPASQSSPKSGGKLNNDQVVEKIFGTDEFRKMFGAN